MRRTNTAKWMEKQKRWQINVQKDGKRRSFTSSITGRNGQREANAKADAWLDDNISGGNEKVSNLYADYVQSLKLTTSRCNWIKVESIGENWILKEIGGKKIAALYEQHFQDIIDQAYASGKSKKTISNIRATINSFIKYCRKRKVSTLILEDLTIPKGARVMEKRILQPQDIETLFSTDKTIKCGKEIKDEYINAYRFQVLTGMRPGEILGLRWSDIQNGMVYIQQAINTLGEITKGKNENAVRHFALTDKAKSVLDDQIKLSNSNSVFEIRSQSGYSKRWSLYCETNGIPHVSLYEMRHTFVSIAKSLPDGQIKPLVGHSKNMDTFGTYGHEVNGELQQTAAKLDDIFDGILNKCVIERVIENKKSL